MTTKCFRNRYSRGLQFGRRLVPENSDKIQEIRAPQRRSEFGGGKENGHEAG